jgi:hypothetical protein
MVRFQPVTDIVVDARQRNPTDGNQWILATGSQAEVVTTPCQISFVIREGVVDEGDLWRHIRIDVPTVPWGDEDQTPAREPEEEQYAPYRAAIKAADKAFAEAREPEPEPEEKGRFPGHEVPEPETLEVPISKALWDELARRRDDGQLPTLHLTNPDGDAGWWEADLR